MLGAINTHLGRGRLTAFFALLVLCIGALDAFLRSYNEVSADDRALGIRTRIDDYTSFEPIGMLPLSLVLALKKWPDHTACLSDPKGDVLRWEDFDTATDVDVCLSKVFGEAVTDEEIVAALAANGFTGVAAGPSSSGRFNGAHTRVMATCNMTSTPCGLTLENLWSFPFQIHAYALDISRREQRTLNVKIVELAK